MSDYRVVETLSLHRTRYVVPNGAPLNEETLLGLEPLTDSYVQDVVLSETRMTMPELVELFDRENQHLSHLDDRSKVDLIINNVIDPVQWDEFGGNCSQVPR